MCTSTHACKHIFTYLCVCLYVFMFTSTCMNGVCVYLSVHVSACLCTCSFSHACTNVCMPVRSCVGACMHECMCSLVSQRTAVRRKCSTHLFIRAVHAEVVFEITVGHQFHDDQSRLSLGHHTNQLDHMVTVKCPAKAKTATSSSAPLHVSQLHKYHKNTDLVQG